MSRWWLPLIAVGCETSEPSEPAAPAAIEPAPRPVAANRPVDPILGDSAHASAIDPLDASRKSSAPANRHPDGGVAESVGPPSAWSPAPGRTWATSVRGVSSEYAAAEWSARRALGAPDVYPAHVDSPSAWASLEADRPEWIELGFPATAVAAVEVYETFNPGAVDLVELIQAGGKRRQLAARRTVRLDGKSELLVVAVDCTRDVIAVRLRVRSERVPGWNEVDAVGLVPCR